MPTTSTPSQDELRKLNAKSNDWLDTVAQITDKARITNGLLTPSEVIKLLDYIDHLEAQLFIDLFDDIYVKKMKTLLFESTIAGLQFHQHKQCDPPATIGEALTLVPEPTNQYDPNAIRVELRRPSSTYMLGYIPRALTEKVFPLLTDKVKEREVLLTYVGSSVRPIMTVGIYGEMEEPPIEDVPAEVTANVEIDL